MAFDKKKDTNPESVEVPRQDTGFDTAPQNAQDVGSATQLNAYYQDLEDTRALAHQAIEDMAEKAKAYVAKFQSQGR